MGEVDGEAGQVRWNDPPSDDALHAASVKRGDFIRESIVPEEGRSTYLGYGCPIDLSDAEPLPGIYAEVNKSLQEGEGRYEGVQERDSLLDGEMRERDDDKPLRSASYVLGGIERLSGLRLLRPDSSEYEVVLEGPTVGPVDASTPEPGDSIAADYVPMSHRSGCGCAGCNIGGPD